VYEVATVGGKNVPLTSQAAGWPREKAHNYVCWIFNDCDS